MAYGDGLYGDSTYSGAPPAASPVALAHIREKPPLRLHIDAETPSGRHYRWGLDEPDPANIPSGLRFSSTMPGGYETMDCELPRKPGIEYQDLERLSTLRVVGPGGQIAGEYRLERAPRSSGDKMAVTPSAVGWQAHLEDDKSAREIYRDIDLGRWQGPSVQRQIDLIAASYTPSAPETVQDPTTPALKTGQTGDWAAAARPIPTATYDATAGVSIGELYYAWTRTSTINAADSNWRWEARAGTTDLVFDDSSGNLRAAGPGTGTLTTTGGARRYLEVVLAYDGGAAGVANQEHAIFWTCLAVYGDHGLTPRGDEPDAGFYASDVVAHAVSTFAPGLTLTEGGDGTVRPSGFPIPHLAFLEATTAAEMVRQATRFGLQDWAVWDNKTFWWHERGAVGRKWRARIGPAQLEETGPQMDRLHESAIVSYQDVDGSTKTVGPIGSGADTEDTSLKDDDPLNPANQLGIIRRAPLAMGVSTAAGAIEVGRRYLEEQKLLDRSGRATFTGHVEDENGVLHPYWKVRAGDEVSFVDASDSSPRRIVKADHSTDSRSCSVDLDSPPEGLQATLERLGVVLQPLGLN